MQNDKTIVAGTARTAATSGDAFSLARLNADGTIDTTFGSNGRVIDDLGTAASSIHDIAIRPSDSKILVAGHSRVSGVDGHEWDEGVVARYTADGQRDADFGIQPGFASSLTSGMTLGSARDHRLSAVTLQPDGKILVAGHVEWVFGGGIDFLVARFREDGWLDNTFGDAGVVTTDFGDSAEDKASDILLQKDGKIVVVGTSHVGGSDDFAVARYTPDGRLDTDFGDGGINTIDFEGGSDRANTAVIQERDGTSTDRIIVGGSAWIDGDRDFALACFTDEGFLDETFNSNGIEPGLRTTNFHFENDEISGIALQANDAIVAVGTSFDDGDSEWALARYTKDGDIDVSFVGGGKRTFDIQGRIRDFAASVAIQETDAKIVVAGYGVDPVSSGESWTVARFYGGAPDLFGLSVDVAPESLRAGDDFEVAFSVENAGPLDAGTFAVGFYLSPDNTYSPDDFEYVDRDYFFLEGEVGAGMTSATARQSLSLPASGHSFWAGDGMYHVGIVVDSDSLAFVEEADEDNNHSVGEGLDVFGIQVRGTTHDVVRPEVSADVSDLAVAGGALYDFDVTYTDDVAVDVSTLDNLDLTVTGPNFFAPVRFVGVDSEIDGSPRMATYRVDAPGGTWNSEDNGTYAIEMRNDAVCDTGGNCVREGTLDWFQVNISPPQQPNLTVSIIPETFSEAAGSDAATGTVTRDGPTTSAVTVTLESNDESEATVPATVVIAAGSASETFAVTAVDDAELDGPQTVTVTASASGFTNSVAAVVVTDYEPATRTLRVGSGDTEADGISRSPSISSDGRYVAFQSRGSNLVPGDTNGDWDVFVYDGQTGAIERVSIASDGTQANRSSRSPSTSADGRYVAFESDAYNLVAGDTNGKDDVFVYDRQTNTIERVSVTSDGSEANGRSESPSISSDGRYVAFRSWASNLVPTDTNGEPDVFVYDRQVDEIERVSVASDGTEADGHSGSPSISSDGRYVAFESWASNLVPGLSGTAVAEVFVYDRHTDGNELVSIAFDGSPGNWDSHSPSISADGRYVVFSSEASDLVQGDTNNTSDVFVYDRQNETTERVSVSTDGSELIQPSYSPSISSDGDHIAFESWAGNIIRDDTNGELDVFVYHRETETIERVSVASDGSEANGGSLNPSINSDGRYIAFESSASNLVPGDTNSINDVFIAEIRDNHSVPNVPNALSASVASSDQINLSWLDNSDNESGFQIERRTGGSGSWNEIGTAGSNATSYQSTGLSANTTYSYRVRAHNAAGNSGYSNEVSATTNGLPTQVTVAVPNFARGPGQPVNVPAATGTGIPLSISDGTGVEHVFVDLRYDPALLEITDAAVGPDAPTGSTVVANVETPGVATLTFITTTPLSSGPATFVTLEANVPTTATYRSKHALDIVEARVNGQTPATGDDGTHLVAYLGDTSGDGMYSELDARNVLMYEVALKDEFPGYGDVRPGIIGDVIGDGKADGLDAVRILQEIIGRDRPEIPPLPDPLPDPLPLTSPGPDPKVFMPTDLPPVSPGDIVTVPILFERLPEEAGTDFQLVSLGLRVRYPSELLTIGNEDVTQGTISSGWLFVPNVIEDVEPGINEIRVSAISVNGANPDDGTLAELQFQINAQAARNAVLDLRATGTVLSNDLGETLVLTPPPEDGTDSVDGLITIDTNQPPTADAGGPYTVPEGGSVQLDGSGTDPENAPLTFEWDLEYDGTTFNIDATGATPTFDAGSIDGEHLETVALRVRDDEDTVSPIDTATVTVTNVAPTIATSGDASVAEGTQYELTLGAIADPGADTVTEWIVDWGDGSTAETFTSGGMKTHTYADGDTDVTIAVDLVDEDGRHQDAGTRGITVNNVAPMVNTDSDSVIVNESDTATNTGTFGDVGDDTVTITASIGTITQDNHGGTWNWSFDTSDGPDESQTVTITAADSDGAQSQTTFGLTVNNVAPSVAVDSGSITVNEGATATNTGTYSDPGVDTVSLSTSIGSITDNGNGTWSWSFGTNDGPDDSQTVTITASDDESASSQIDFELTVDNVAPQAVDDYYAFDGKGVFEVLEAHGLLANDTDPGADRYTVDAVSAPAIDPAYGTVDVNPDGSFSYTPPHEGFSTRVDFVYEVTDDDDASSEATATIDVGINGVIEGYVYADQNNSTGFDASRDIGLPSVRVTLISTDPPVEEEAATDRNGRYRFENLPAGTYRVIVNTPDKCIDDGEHEIAVELGVNEVKDGKNLAEGWLRPRHMSIGMLLASSPSWQEMLQQSLGAAVEEGEFDRDFAYDIGEGEMVGTVSPEPITTFQATTAVEAVPASPALSESHPLPPVSTADTPSASVDAHQVSATAVPVGSNVVGQNDSLLFDDGSLGEPQQVDLNVVRLIQKENALPTSLELGVTFNVQPAMIDRWRNALIVFDYKSPTDFKFAGAFVGIDNWAIGRMTERGYVLDQLVRDKIEFGTDYEVRLVLDGADVVLKVDDIPVISHIYEGAFADGELGLLSYEDGAEFKDLKVRRI